MAAAGQPRRFVDPLYREMLIATEDQRFARHPGVDALAALRAFGQLAAHGHIVSGASTLTMQAVRLLERRPRSLAAKLAQAAGGAGAGAAARQGGHPTASI